MYTQYIYTNNFDDESLVRKSSVYDKQTLMTSVVRNLIICKYMMCTILMLQLCKEISSFHLKRTPNYFYHKLCTITNTFDSRSSTSIEANDDRINKHKSLVICGPSGVGKGTLINKLLSSYPEKFSLSVSYTSRNPREHEVDGKHYHFVDKEFLINDIKNGPIKYVEHAEVHSNLYGTRQDDVDAIHKDNKICILDIDVNGVKQLKVNYFPAIYVFIRPVSISALEQRLRDRNTESEAQIQLRLKNASNEIDYGDDSSNFDFVLTNDQLDECYMNLDRRIKEWFPQVFETKSLLNNHNH